MSKKQSPFIFYPIATDTKLSLPIVDSSDLASFLCSVDGAYTPQYIELNKEFFEHLETTFLLRVVGDSMIDEGVEDGDMLIVDRSAKPKEESLSVCICKGEYVLKRIVQTDNGLQLVPDNSKNQPITAAAADDLQVWGVVRFVMKKKV